MGRRLPSNKLQTSPKDPAIHGRIPKASACRHPQPASRHSCEGFRKPEALRQYCTWEDARIYSAIRAKRRDADLQEETFAPPPRKASATGAARRPHLLRGDGVSRC
ncbi:hypothetical protein NDU88_000187 [Pleurodeles waltl]|uniref:Uncharacterized protein n=1 Tax=Pleurodeles waltl TaxID=8319 RepID=A0AAV7S6W2_PLEWA|nr:hypothetical protein NDU88_000187 [Pleurodeles waltl]